MMLRLATIALVLSTACSSVDGYSTAPGESLCGGLPSPPSFTSGLSLQATMRLTLDATQIDGTGTPGAVWIAEPASGATPARRLVDGAPLTHIPALDGDALGTPDLGSGVDHTRLFSLASSTPDQAAFVAAVSLRSDGSVQVRLLQPGGSPTFGVFNLTKQTGTCGF